jgi:hypothetical protein
LLLNIKFIENFSYTLGDTEALLTRDSNMLGALKFYLLGVNGAGEMPIT